jgi:hypothetical protein
MARSDRHFIFIKRSRDCGRLDTIFRNIPKLLAFWILTMLTNPGFSQKESSAELTDFTGKNYKLQYPASWTLDTSKSLGPAIFFFSPLENPEDKFSENVNVLIQDLKGEDINLSQYKEITDKQVKDFASDGEILESSILRKNNQEFYRITYTMSQGKFRVKITSVCFIQNEKAYLSTFSAEVDKYDAYKKTAEQILTSFKVSR